MLIEKIKTHHELTGFWFSTIEYAVVALIIAPFAVYYLTHARMAAGMVATGIVANALTLVAFGVQGIVTRQKDIGILKMFDPKTRAEIALRYPQLQRDTLILTITPLIPFLLLLVVAYEMFRTLKRDDSTS